MRFLMVLFLAITLSLSPSAAFCRDVKKYTVEYNARTLETLGEELYRFVAGLDKLEDNHANRKNILKNVFDTIDRYHCEEKLYIAQRGIKIEAIENKITHIRITIKIWNSLDIVDTVVLIFDINAAKNGIPIKIKRSRIQV